MVCVEAALHVEVLCPVEVTHRHGDQFQLPVHTEVLPMRSMLRRMSRYGQISSSAPWRFARRAVFLRGTGSATGRYGRTRLRRGMWDIPLARRCTGSLNS